MFDEQVQRISMELSTMKLNSLYIILIDIMSYHVDLFYLRISTNTRSIYLMFEKCIYISSYSLTLELHNFNRKSISRISYLFVVFLIVLANIFCSVHSIRGNYRLTFFIIIHEYTRD